MLRFTGLLFTLIILGCATAKPTQSDIDAVIINSSSDFAGDRHSKTFFKGDLIQYEALEAYFDAIDHIDTLSGAVTRTINSQQWRTYYFVYHKDSLFGIWYQNDHDTTMKATRISVETMRAAVKGGNTWDKIDTPPDSVKRTANSLTQIWYKQPDSLLGPMSLTLEFSSRLNHLKETLNHNLDSMRSMKLIRVAVVAKEQEDTVRHKKLRGFHEIMEMAPLDDFDRAKVESYFQRYLSGK